MAAGRSLAQMMPTTQEHPCLVVHGALRMKDRGNCTSSSPQLTQFISLFLGLLVVKAHAVLLSQALRRLMQLLGSAMSLQGHHTVKVPPKASESSNGDGTTAALWGLAAVNQVDLLAHLTELRTQQ